MRTEYTWPKRAKRKIRGLIRKWLERVSTQFVKMYYMILPFRNGINNKEQRSPRIIVSFTSYPKRFTSIPLVVKSILYQSCKPDKIILYLAQSECMERLPKQLLKLQKYGLEIVFVNDNLKSHKKYFYSMSAYPDDIIITIDDDLLYPKNMITMLYKSYHNYPDCVSASRVRRMKIRNHKLCKYDEWDNCYKKEHIPSHWLFAIGCGGTLYPPGILPKVTFDRTNIERICFNADDVWLKFMELMNDIKVVYVPGANDRLWLNGKFGRKGLAYLNVERDQNDTYIENVGRFFDFNVEEFLMKAEGKHEKVSKVSSVV